MVFNFYVWIIEKSINRIMKIYDLVQGFFSNATNLTGLGIAVAIHIEGSVTCVLNDEKQYIEAYMQSRKALKLKFVRP